MPKGRDDPRRPPREQPPPPPPEETNALTILGGSLPVSFSTGLRRLSREDIVEQFPDVLALIDFRATEETEFIPVGEDALRLFLEAGTDIRISGQIFQERPAANILFGGA